MQLENKKIVAGITLFNPEIQRLTENISAIIGQVDKVICVDNGSKNIKDIEQLLTKQFPEVYCIQNGENLGIARALNEMFEYAKENQYGWVLTLDQDSVCPDNMISEYKKHLNYERVGTICPLTKDRNHNRDERSELEYEEVDKCITSASLIPVIAWEDVGGFFEELFIDFVDHDFCAKLRLKDYKILRVNNVILLHELGNAVDHNILGIKFTALNHSPFRKYYMVRNWMYYMAQYGNVINLKGEKRSFYLFFVKTFLFESNRVEKIKRMIKGYKDGKKFAAKHKTL